MSPSRMSELNDMHGTNPDRFRSQQLYNMTRELHYNAFKM